MQTEKLFQLNYSMPVDLSAFEVDEEELYSPFLWQKKFESLKNERLVSLTASTGAGKSHAIKYHAISWSGKNVIVVPKLQIGQEFQSCQIKDSSGTKLHFNSTNLCEKSPDSSIKELVRFFKSRDSNTKYNKTMVVCVPTLVEAFRKVGRVSNLRLIIDEAHHVSTCEDEDGNLNPNGLGEVMSGVLRGRTNSVLLVTATHFRSDKTTIIPTNYVNKFKEFEVPYYEVQEQCRRFNKEISFGYAFHKNGASEGIGKAFDPKQPTIIFASRNGAAGTPKKKDKYVRDAIKEMGFEIVSENSNGTFTIKKGRKKLIVADLIHPSRHDKALKYIKEVSKDSKTYGIDVIFALERFKEGCDYPPLQHCIIDGIRESYGDMIQMFGRVTRDFPDKKNCSCTILIENKIGYNKDDVSEKVQQHLNFIISCMCMADFFKPFRMRIKGESKKSGGNGGPSSNILTILGDRVNQVAFIEKAVKKFTAFTSDKPEHKENCGLRLKTMNKIVFDMLPENLQKHSKDVADRILKEMAAIMVINNGGVDISELDVRLLEKVDTTKFAYQFLSKNLGASGFRDFKKNVYGVLGEKRTFEEHLILAKENKLVAEKWEKYYKKNNLSNQGYYKYPWQIK
ncbi:MAG: hypothetical protein ACOCXG_04580 [Nanoarchaeota archaeon]